MVCKTRSRPAFAKVPRRGGESLGIDPSCVVLGLFGRGLHPRSAYIDDLDEVPDAIDLTQPGLQGAWKSFPAAKVFSGVVHCQRLRAMERMDGGGGARW